MKTYDITQNQIESLPVWARRRPLRRKNFLAQLKLTLRAVRHFPALIKHLDTLDLQTS